MKAYEESLKEHWDEYSILKSKKEEGKNEKAIEIAINLIKEGSEIKFISKITGIPMDKIEELRKNLK